MSKFPLLVTHHWTLVSPSRLVESGHSHYQNIYSTSNMFASGLHSDGRKQVVRR